MTKKCQEKEIKRREKGDRGEIEGRERERERERKIEGRREREGEGEGRHNY